MRTAIFRLAVAAWIPIASAQVDARRSRVEWELSSGPTEGSTHPQDVNFDRTAKMRVHLFSLQRLSREVRMQFLFFYDEVSSSGKVEGKVETQEQVARIVRAGDHMVASDGFRLSGKITKKGTLTGMRWVGCVARVYEEGCLVFEHYQPVTVKELAAKVSGPAVEARRETPPPLPSAKPLSSPSASPASSPDGGATTVLGVAFTAAEAKAALEAANTLSEEDLIRKVGLTRKAAKNVVAARPVAAIGQLPKISYVKAVALAALKNYVSSDEAGK